VRQGVPDCSVPGGRHPTRVGRGRSSRTTPDSLFRGLTQELEHAGFPAVEVERALAWLEELGFLGGIIVFLLFIWLIWRVLLVGWRSGSVFGIAFAGGVASMIVFQILVNAGMIVGMMPVTGIPLPFITHGGASLVSTAIALGLMQSIAMRSEQPRPSW